MPIDILHEEFIFKTFVCEKLNFIKKELPDVKQNTNKIERGNCNYETCHINTLDEQLVLSEINSSFLLQELHNKQIITERLLDNIAFNSDKGKTVKHFTEKHQRNV